MSELRLFFTKEGTASYISHLDLLRTFQRAFIRAGMVIRHSSGFHPHPLMSFVLPLSVGQSSEYELLDFETAEELDGEGLPARLNACLPDGVRVWDCCRPEKKARELDALQAVVVMEYDRPVSAGTEKEITDFLLGGEVIAAKRNKKKQVVDVDIRPMIRSVAAKQEGESVVLRAVVQAQNPGVNPALLAAAVGRHLPGCRPDFVRVRRLALLDGGGELFR